MPLQSVREQRVAARRLRKRILDASNRGKIVAVEVFSGSGRVARNWRLFHGFHAIAVDIRNKCKRRRYDVTSKPVLKVLRNALLTKRVRCLWLGTPCSSFTLARRGFPGTPGGPLRLIGEYILGHPTAMARDMDRLKIEAGNRCASATAELCRAAQTAACPWGLENPYASRLWHHPDIKKCQDLPGGVHTRRSDMCAYNCKYRKSTRVMLGRVDHDMEPELLQKRCGGKGKICGHKGGCEHAVLEGKCPKTGQSRTAAAQVYPHQFARDAADLLAAALHHPYC